MRTRLTAVISMAHPPESWGPVPVTATGPSPGEGREKGLCETLSHLVGKSLQKPMPVFE